MFGRKPKPPTELELMRARIAALLADGDKRLEATLARLRARLAEHEHEAAK